MSSTALDSRTSPEPASDVVAGGRSLLTLADCSEADVAELVATAAGYARTPGLFAGRLRGRRVGLVFTAPSTRTRTSFWSAATSLGCDVLSLGPDELQVSTGETWHDTGAVLRHYLDAVVIRTNGPQREMRELAGALPATVNALSYEEHPTQAVADLCALQDHFGDTGGLRLAYVGAVNNSSRSLAHLACRTGAMTLDVYSPPGAGHDRTEVTELNRLAGREAVRQFDEVPAAPTPVDAVYTCRWRSMGAARSEPGFEDLFRPFAVTRSLMSRFSGDREAVFMHDLPAVREQEVTSEVMDGPLSLVGRQAFHKASAAAAALLWTLGGTVAADA